MGPNDAEIIRVYTRQAGSQVADDTIDSGSNAEVVIEAEAGSALFSLQAQYHIGLFVLDLITGQQINFTTPLDAGQLGKPRWVNPASQFTYSITSAELTQHKGHLCRAHAYVLIGGSQFDASFAESPVFLVLP